MMKNEHSVSMKHSASSASASSVSVSVSPLSKLPPIPTTMAEMEMELETDWLFDDIGGIDSDDQQELHDAADDFSHQHHTDGTRTQQQQNGDAIYDKYRALLSQEDESSTLASTFNRRLFDEGLEPSPIACDGLRVTETVPLDASFESCPHVKDICMVLLQPPLARKDAGGHEQRQQNDASQSATHTGPQIEGADPMQLLLRQKEQQQHHQQKDQSITTLSPTSIRNFDPHVIQECDDDNDDGDDVDDNNDDNEDASRAVNNGSNTSSNSNDASGQVRKNGAVSTCSASSNPPPQNAVQFRQYQRNMWIERFDELVEFHGKHGHCNVEPDDDKRLSHWVKRQRYQWRQRQKHGRRSVLTEDRKRKLDDLGFLWSSHDVAWESQFARLLRYKSRHGHTNVPTQCNEDPSLGIWVKGQRRQYRLHKDGKRSSLTKQRIQRLNDVDFFWTVRPTPEEIMQGQPFPFSLSADGKQPELLLDFHSTIDQLASTATTTTTTTSASS